MLAGEGVTAIEVSMAALTFNIAVALCADGHRFAFAQVAVSVMRPGVIAVASPVAFTVAIATLDDVQTRSAVMSCVEASVNVPFAKKGAVVPATMLAVPGVIAMPTTVANVTLTLALPLCPSRLAVTATVHGATPSTLAVDGSTVATAELADTHVTFDVTSACVLSL